MKERLRRALALALGLSVVWAVVASYRRVPAHREGGLQRCGSCHSDRVPPDHSPEWGQRGHGPVERWDRQACISCHRPRFHRQCAQCHQPGEWSP